MNMGDWKQEAVAYAHAYQSGDDVRNGINYKLLPEHLRDGAQRWIEQGIEPGGFLRAVIRNDFTEAVVRADSKCVLVLPAIAKFWHNEAPKDCWGSETKFNIWHASHMLDRARES